MKPKLYSYVRFSSAKQREGNSLERQQDTALRIASRYDLELDTTAFHDLGMSAFKGKNAHEGGNDSNLLIVFYVQIMPDD
ncbi:recombinase family protein, partial [Enterobacter hormaechei]|uniref:recombinase family protein n=1 Tax=Enterobacter hormaechei TaxID=158836 RepID=UPI0018E5A483